MTAYILLNGRYFNPDRTAMRSYTEHVQPTMASYGGRYRRGLPHRLEVLEGDWHPRMFGIVEFPTFEQARAWYDSPEYAPLKADPAGQRAQRHHPRRRAGRRPDVRVAAALRGRGAGARLDAFLAEAERRGVPPDRFHPGEPIEAVLAASGAEPSPAPAPGDGTSAAALERVLSLLPALDPEGRQRVMARCQALDARAGG